MIDAFLSDFSLIKEMLDKDGAHQFFGQDFSFFSNEPVLFYNPARDTIAYANLAFFREFGYEQTDIENWNYSIFPLFNADDQLAFKESLKKLTTNGNGFIEDANYRLVLKNRKSSYYRVKIRRLYKGHYYIQLERSVLEDKIQELNKSNAELEEFAYVASHDMQEPLRKISTFGQRLKTQCTDQLGEDGNMYLSRMLGASENMRNLIDNLLEFSRVSRNKQLYERTDLHAIINQVIDDLDMRIAETNSTITVEPPLPEIEANPSQMRQLLFNLLQNAIKFRKKETQLVIHVRNRVLTVAEKKQYQLAVDQEYYVISVSDNGIGFEQQYAERIFQLFQRLEGKSEYPGTGIGLSICRKIVMNHQGLIFSESEPGKGTTFFIILPKHQ